MSLCKRVRLLSYKTFASSADRSLVSCIPSQSIFLTQHRVRPEAPSNTLQNLPNPARCTRQFSVSAAALGWLAPAAGTPIKGQKGRCRVCTGGSIRGTTVVWGDYGLRLRDHDRRVSAAQLKVGEEIIKRRLRGMTYKMFTRVSANICVYKKGNEQRMGKGKGKFDHWACRIPVSRVVFEIKADLHEKVLLEALRIAGDSLPGLWEAVKKGDPPVAGITKLGDGVTLETLRRARKTVPKQDPSLAQIGPIETSSPPMSVSSITIA